MLNSGTTKLSGCTFVDDSAQSNGGGLDNFGGTATLIDCTVSGDSAQGNGGGLLTSRELVNALVYSCTISGNSAQVGGGLYNSGGKVSLSATRSWRGTGHHQRARRPGSFASQGNDLIGETDGSMGWVSSDLTGTIAQPLDPMLAPLGNYGGPTEDDGPAARQPRHRRRQPHPAASPPTSAASPGPPADPDIGAFQTQPIDAGGQHDGRWNRLPAGQLTLRQAVNIDHVLTAEPITFPSLFNTPQTITLTGGQLELSNTNGTEAIAGPGANLLTVSGGGTRGLPG